MSTFYNPKIVSDGLVLCLDAGNNKSYIGSGTAWNDLSGNGNNGTLTNGPTFNSANGGGIVFDGTNDYVSIPYTTNPSYFSFELTFSATALGGSTIIYVGKYNGAGNDYWLGWNGTSLVFSTNGSILSVNSISTGTKYVITCVIGASAKTVYMNGVLLNSAATITCAPGGNISIGTFGDTGGYYPAAIIHSYKIYNRALSASEVLQNYNSAKSRFGL